MADMDPQQVQVPQHACRICGGVEGELIQPCPCDDRWHYECLGQWMVAHSDEPDHNCHNLFTDHRIVRDNRDSFATFLVQRPHLAGVSAHMAVLLGWFVHSMAPSMVTLTTEIMDGQLNQLPMLMMYMAYMALVMGAIAAYRSYVMPRYEEWAAQRLNHRVTYLHDFDGLHHMPGAVHAIDRGIILPAIQAKEQQEVEEELQELMDMFPLRRSAG